MARYEERRADFEAFSEKNGNLQDDLSRRISAIRLHIEGESENAILSADEDQYINKLVADNTIQVPELLYDQITFNRHDVIVKRRGMDQCRFARSQQDAAGSDTRVGRTGSALAVPVVLEPTLAPHHSYWQLMFHLTTSAQAL
jgi:hypothetical protein